MHTVQEYTVHIYPEIHMSTSRVVINYTEWGC